LNAARREIERLRRGFDRMDHSAPDRPTCTTNRLSPQGDACAPLSLPRPRKPYAVEPLGEPAPHPASSRAAACEQMQLHAFLRVTNLGSLIDVIA
jgi:hypothetical protein